jgi:hypothetical protein
MRKVLATGTAITLLFAAAPMTVVHADTEAAATAKPKPPPKVPKKRLAKQLPKFATQPKVIKDGNKYAVVADVRLIPWHTKTRHVNAKADRMSVQLAVATKNQQMRYVGLSAKGLMWSDTMGPRKVMRTGTYTLAIPVTKKVGKSLASQTPQQQRKRLRMTVEHRKDVRAQIEGRDVLQLAQSGVPSDKLASQLAGSRLSGNGESTSILAQLVNYTPFELVMSAQGVNCVSPGAWTGTVDSYDYVQYTAQVYTSGTAMANDYDSAGKLASAAVSALSQSAQSAAQAAMTAGAALFTPQGAIAEGVTWQVDFITDFIKDLEAESCSTQPSLFTTSAAVVGASYPSDSQDAGDYGSPDPSAPAGPTLVTFPPGWTAYQMYGAQSSTTWHWNNNEPQPTGPGSFSWAGGLISMGTWNSDSLGIDYYFESDASNPTGFGPAPTVWPPNSSVTNSGSLTAQWNSGSMDLSCDPGEWNLFNPWGDSLAITPGALTPANTNEYSGNQMYMAVSYSGTDAAGNQVNGATFPGVEPVEAYSTETQTFTVDSSALEGITVDEWQCSVGTAIQVGDWSIPSSWPTDFIGTNPNGAWVNAPNMVLTAPYVAP